MTEGVPGSSFQDEVMIRRRRWASRETGFAVIDADRAGDEIVLVGTIAHLEERERVRISGLWQEDRRYGMQIKVTTAEPLAPAGEPALLAYLKRVRHVGGTRAARLLDLYGEAVLEVIDRDPHAAFRRLGLGRGRIPEAVKSWDGLRSSRALHLLLAPHGLAWLVTRIENHYGAGAYRVVRERPYDLTSVFGVGSRSPTRSRARSTSPPARRRGPARACCTS
jgi:exodeoxyribonuclease V alpha subunit